MKGICTKTGLVKSLRRFYKSPNPAACDYNVYDSTPTTFLVLSDCKDTEYQDFVQRFKELERGCNQKERMQPKHCASNMWLIKPAAENQGRGIEIFKNDLVAMKNTLSSKPPNTYWVVQKYIEKPLLYCGRKFDIRVWAIMTWKHELYYYKHGYIRTSSDEYSLNSNLNYVHLTNNCLQQYGEKYSKFEDGNTLPYNVIEDYIMQRYPSFSFETHIVPRIKDLIIDTYLSVKTELNPCKRRNCFELLGYDFVIDEDMRTWLIEVNANPYLGVPNKFIEGLLPKMLNDMLKLNLDPHIKIQNTQPQSGTSRSTIDLDNQFELIYCDKKRINQRRTYDLHKVYPIAELAPQHLQQAV